MGKKHTHYKDGSPREVTPREIDRGWLYGSLPKNRILFKTKSCNVSFPIDLPKNLIP